MADESEARDGRGPFARYGDFIGLVIVGVGLVLIALGWYAAMGSRGQVNGQPEIRAQLRYLLPTAALGSSLAVFGTGVLILHALRRTRDRTEAMLLAMAERLDDAVLGPVGGSAATPGPELVVAGTAAYHASTCRLVNVRDATDLVTPEEAALRGLRPCGLCRPRAPREGAAA